MISRFNWHPRIAPKSAFGAAQHTLTFFTYRADVKLPLGWEMAAVGTDFKKAAPGCYIAESTTPVSSFPLVFLRNYETHCRSLAEGNGMLSIYYQRGFEGIARAIASMSADILDYYSNLYYVLDYRNISIVQGSPGPVGITADSIVILGDGAFGAVNRVLPGVMDPSLSYLLAHELAHFYFGIGSPPDFLTPLCMVTVVWTTPCPEL